MPLTPRRILEAARDTTVNGNGRWSRLASDALIVALGGSRFTWGGASLANPGALRRDYIAALQAADANADFRPLLTFSRR